VCRLIAGTRGGDVDLVERLCAASHLHSDGWGIAWWTKRQQGYMRGASPAFGKGSGFSQASSIIAERSRVTYLCHVRKRSVAPVRVSNSHPFLADGWAFAHNGTIPRLISKDRTDSEVFFETELLPGLRAGENPVEVIRNGIAHPGPTYTAMNFVLTDGRRLYALEAHRIKPSYYTLRWDQGGTGVCVASSGIAPDRWVPLGNGNLLIVDGEVNVVNVTTRQGG
jgi:predicted glutamine amidotransferase